MRWPAALAAIPSAMILCAGGPAHSLPQRESAEIEQGEIRALQARGLAAPVSQADCGGGSYSVVNSPDGTAVSVLFDDFTVRSSQLAGGLARTKCVVRIPLNLPPGYSLGVFRMDYRGFAYLSPGQLGGLSIDYGIGRKGRALRRKLAGPHDGDFRYVDNLGAGLMKRAGCGEAAAIDLSGVLELRQAARSPEAMVTLDSIDGAARTGVTFFVDLKRC